MKDQKILITGGAGFIGSNLVKALKDDNEVVVIDNYSIGVKENEFENVQYIGADVRYVQNIQSLVLDFDYIFHLAALSRIQPSFEDPMETLSSNLLGTVNILNEARKMKNLKKFVYSGSSSRWHNPNISPYARSKASGEDYVNMYSEVFGLNTEIARFYNVYGPMEITHGDWAAVVGKFRGQVEDGNPLTIVGDGTQRRTFTHVDDIVDGLIKIALTEEKVDAWELGSNKNYSINEVADMFDWKFGVGREYIPKRPGEYKSTTRENDLAIQLLNWTPKGDLEKYIESL